MSFVIYIYTILKFFIYMIFCATIYMIYRNNADREFKDKSLKLEEKLEIEILENIDRNRVSKSLVKRYKKAFKNEVFFISFNEVVIRLKEEKGIEIKEFVMNFLPELNEKMKKYRNPIKRNYLSFCLGEYGIYTEEIEKYLLNQIKKSEGELSYKAITATARIGNVDLFFKALDEVRRKKIYINKKIFIDILDSFKGDKKTLSNKLYKIFNESDVEFKVIIINSFENAREERYKEKFFEVLKNEKDLEVVLSIIRYFEKIYYPEVREGLVEYLSNSIWEIRALSAKALTKYFNEEVKEKLIDTLGDRNFNVRLNCAKTLRQNCTMNEMEEIAAKLKDKYAKDIVYYELLSEGKISYEKYKASKKEVI